MSGTGDYDHEMFRRTTLDEEAFEQVLAGRPAAADPLLASFVEDVQLATTGPAPAAAPALATLFAEGLSTDKGDLLVTAGSNVTGPASQAAGLPKWRKKNVIEVALAKLGALGLAAKLGVASSVLVLSGTAAAATGSLPDVAQDRVADAVERTGIDIPGGRSADHRQDGDHRQDADARQDGEHRADDDADSNADTADQADFGTGVAGDAKNGAPQDDGQQFGDDVSTDARDTFQPTDTPTADDNPGTEYRDDAGTQQPEGTPTADDNPGTEYKEGAGDQQPDGTPTADDNPGTGRRP